MGSHKGEYIININKRFTINKIFGFEPNPRSYELLLRNTKKMKNTEVFNFAAGKEEGISILNQNTQISNLLLVTP